MDKNENLKFLDTLSTQMLENFLEAYQTSENPGEEDLAVVQYILDLLARRSRETDSVPDVDRAWQEFHRDYLPLKGQEPLYGSPENAGSGHRGRKVLRRLVTTAAVVVLIVFAANAAALAAGYNLWQIVTSWTDQVFTVESGNPGPAAPEWKNAALTELLQDYGIPEHFVPQWMPEGYELITTDTAESPAVTSIMAIWDNGDRQITMLIRHMSVAVMTTYEKDEGEPVAYTIGDITYYVMQNFGEYLAVWEEENDQISISVPGNEEDLHKIIASIYGN